jgi:hypothetical protein
VFKSWVKQGISEASKIPGKDHDDSVSYMFQLVLLHVSGSGLCFWDRFHPPNTCFRGFGVDFTILTHVSGLPG